MSCGFVTAAPDGPVYRLARLPDPWAWPDWSRASSDGTFGNRWDDPRGTYRVLYASSSRRGALIETLARFRPDIAVVAELAEIDGGGDPIAAGSVPRSWFRGRLLGVATLEGAYADVGAAKSLAIIRSRLAATALHFGLYEIDAAAIRVASPRGFTQAVSRLVYECGAENSAAFAGIRYASRLDDPTTNWAVFEPGPAVPPPLRAFETERLDADDPDVQYALDVLGLHAAPA